MVRNAFGRPDMDYQDIYNHVTSPENLVLLESDKVIAMGSYNCKKFSGIPSLIVEGVAIDPQFQGRGIFSELTNQVLDGTALISLRTQNPNMYRSLENYCAEIYPNEFPTPSGIQAVLKDFAKYLGCEINEKGVVKGYYGGLFYDKEPVHPTRSALFKNVFELNINQGDAVLAIGVK
ncbi:MAG: GNAT family N-acetyltransferase [Nanoarchaeota archaeon]